jgi:hypothetical protein
MRYDMKISQNKTKILAFTGKDAVRTTIVIDGNVIEQVKYFNYLRFQLSWMKSYDMEAFLHTFQLFCGTIKRTLLGKVQEHMRIVAGYKLVNKKRNYNLTQKSHVLSLLSTIKKYQEKLPLGKNEGNPNSKYSAEVQTISTIKPRTTAIEMETTVCTGAGTNRKV